MSIRLSDVFPKIVCVCLDKRESEWQKVEYLIKSYGGELIQYIVGSRQTSSTNLYNYIDDPHKGQKFNYGTCLHNIIRYMKENNIPRYLHLEDDVIFDDNFENIFSAAIRQIDQQNIDFDLLYLGANHAHNLVYRVSENLVRLTHSNGLHAVCINESVYDKILELSPIGIDNGVAVAIHKLEKSYGIFPNIAFQKPCWSYNINQYVDKVHIYRQPVNIADMRTIDERLLYC